MIDLSVDRLFLDSWGYNSVRVLTRLARIVEEDGGKIVFRYGVPHYEIHNRNHEAKVLNTSFREYIHFVKDDAMYYFSLDRNPFFPFYYSKAPYERVECGDVVQYVTRRGYCLDELGREWAADELLLSVPDDSFIDECARVLYALLMQAKNSFFRKKGFEYRDNYEECEYDKAE